TVTVGGVPMMEYRVWIDPGSPYAPGHMARICGDLSEWTPAGTGEVRLTTARGVSNAIQVTVNNQFSSLTRSLVNRSPATRTSRGYAKHGSGEARLRYPYVSTMPSR